MTLRVVGRGWKMADCESSTCPKILSEVHSLRSAARKQPRRSKATANSAQLLIAAHPILAHTEVIKGSLSVVHRPSSTQHHPIIARLVSPSNSRVGRPQSWNDATGPSASDPSSFECYSQVMEI